MTDIKFTPGPWKAMDDSIQATGRTDTFDGIVWCSIARVDRLLATDADGRVWTCEGSEKANATLISAAPDLYGALDELADIIDGLVKDRIFPLEIDSFTTQPARTALHKACGET